MKKRIAVFLILAALSITGCGQGNAWDATKNAIITEDEYTILSQELVKIELCVPKSVLSGSIYSERQDFEENEVVAYKDDTTSIWLEYVQPPYGSDEVLHFGFRCSYTLPAAGGSFLSVNKYKGDGTTAGTSTSWLGDFALTDDNTSYEDAINVISAGGSESLVFYVSAEAVKAAEGTMKMSTRLNELSYERSGGSFSIKIRW